MFCIFVNLYFSIKMFGLEWIGRWFSSSCFLLDSTVMLSELDSVLQGVFKVLYLYLQVDIWLAMSCHVQNKFETWNLKSVPHLTDIIIIAKATELFFFFFLHQGPLPCQFIHFLYLLIAWFSQKMFKLYVFKWTITKICSDLTTHFFDEVK